jgi:excinuclease ABC subunit A
MTERVVVRGAREHNLKNIDVAFPRGCLCVITGPSGSGKSSLAFDTIYAEGQRRYVESLSVRARRQLGGLSKPDVDLIEGLSPAIGVQAGELHHSPRSTVGTVTEIHDLLQLLFARVGQQHCPRCGHAVEALSVPQMVDRVLSRAPGARFSVRAPYARGLEGDAAAELAQLRADGFVRAVVDGALIELADVRALRTGRAHSIDVDVDRLSVKPESRSRLSESIELGLRKGNGLVRIAFEGGEALTLVGREVCANCGLELGELTPASLSWYSERGACERCRGLGRRMQFDPARVVPDDALSLRGGAIAAWGAPEGRYYQAMLAELQAAMAVDADKPFAKLPAATRERVLRGGGKKGYAGVIAGLERRLSELERRRGDEESYDFLLQELEPFMLDERCDACLGARLNPRALALRVDGANVFELSSLELEPFAARLRGVSWPSEQAKVAEPIVREIAARIAVLVDLGVGYVDLARESRTLSRGEAERIRLAAHLGANLAGVLYVLDEPTTGLHPRDTQRLLRTLLALRDRGNTVLVVEHDIDLIAAADHVIDLGPRSGERGGELMASGTPAEVAATPGAPTAPYLRARKGVEPARRSEPAERFIRVRDARTHNLRGVDADVPLGRVSCVTGVSGSGKSSLVMHTLLPAAQAALRGEAPRVAARVEGLEAIGRVVHLGQASIGRTPRSTPATYVGVFGAIRELFAELPESRVRGFGAERFSFNAKGGRCERCQGAGGIRVDMQFLPDVYVRCDVCGGRRYDRETLEPRYRGRNIADVLDATVDEASELFAQLPRVSEAFSSMRAVGLGYLRLGQSATTLSAGEAQRLRLARELIRRDAAATLYALDEPTAGLHPSEVELLAQVLEGLAARGHTVVVVEHNLELAARADFVLDLGPEGGAAGGQVIAAGTPLQVALSAASQTAPFLAARLGVAR